MASQVKRPSALSCAPKASLGTQPQSSQIMPIPHIPDYPRSQIIPPYFDYPRSLDKDEPGQAGTVPLSQVSHNAGIILSQ